MMAYMTEKLVIKKNCFGFILYADWLCTKAPKLPNIEYILIFTSTSLCLNFD